MFSAVILKFYSVWWHFSLFKYEQISRHNPFTFFLQINNHTISLSKPITFCARSSVLQGFPTVGMEGKCPLCTASQLKNKPKIFISKLDSFMKPKTWSWQAWSRVRNILIISGGLVIAIIGCIFLSARRWFYNWQGLWAGRGGGDIAVYDNLGIAMYMYLPPLAAASISGPVIPSPNENTVLPLPDPSLLRDSWDWFQLPPWPCKSDSAIFFQTLV